MSTDQRLFLAELSALLLKHNARICSGKDTQNPSAHRGITGEHMWVEVGPFDLVVAAGYQITCNEIERCMAEELENS